MKTKLIEVVENATTEELLELVVSNLKLEGTVEVLKNEIKSLNKELKTALKAIPKVTTPEPIKEKVTTSEPIKEKVTTSEPIKEKVEALKKEVAEEVEDINVKLEDMSQEALRRVAKAQGVKGTTSMKKPELLEILNEGPDGSVPTFESVPTPERVPVKDSQPMNEKPQVRPSRRPRRGE